MSSDEQWIYKEKRSPCYRVYRSRVYRSWMLTCLRTHPQSNWRARHTKLSNLAALVSSPSSLILLVRALWITFCSLEVNERCLYALSKPLFCSTHHHYHHHLIIIIAVSVTKRKKVIIKIIIYNYWLNSW